MQEIETQFFFEGNAELVLVTQWQAIESLAQQNGRSINLSRHTSDRAAGGQVRQGLLLRGQRRWLRAIESELKQMDTRLRTQVLTKQVCHQLMILTDFVQCSDCYCP